MGEAGRREGTGREGESERETNKKEKENRGREGERERATHGYSQSAWSCRAWMEEVVSSPEKSVWLATTHRTIACPTPHLSARGRVL